MESDPRAAWKLINEILKNDSLPADKAEKNCAQWFTDFSDLLKRNNNTIDENIKRKVLSKRN